MPGQLPAGGARRRVETARGCAPSRGQRVVTSRERAGPGGAEVAFRASARGCARRRALSSRRGLPSGWGGEASGAWLRERTRVAAAHGRARAVIVGRVVTTRGCAPSRAGVS
jgi:hypothetical protein